MNAVSTRLPTPRLWWAILLLLTTPAWGANPWVVGDSYFLKKELQVSDSSQVAKYAPPGASFTVAKRDATTGDYTVNFLDAGNAASLSTATNGKIVQTKGDFVVSKAEQEKSDYTRLTVVARATDVTMQSIGDLVGDNFYLATDTNGFVNADSTKASEDARCAPSGSIFIVSDVMRPSEAQAGHPRTIWVRFVRVGERLGVSDLLNWQTKEPSKTTKAASGSTSTSTTSDGPPAVAQVTTSCAEDKRVNTFTTYTYDVDRMRETTAFRTGLVHGLLVVPFKYHRSNHDLSGEQSIGYYVGVRNVISGSSLALVGSVGLSSVSIPDSQAIADGASPTTTTSKTGLTLAVGGIFTILKSTPLQVGFFVGYDVVSKSVGYQYNGHPWFAVAIGFDFSR